MDGKVLFVGGAAENSKAAANLRRGISKPGEANVLATRLNVARQKHKATLLADGRILIEAGVDEVGNQVGAIEAFTPETVSSRLLDQFRSYRCSVSRRFTSGERCD